jgi:type II secretory pathway pseudopilin PulG
MRSRRIVGSRNRTDGFTLIEVALALTIFLAMVVVFAAVFPISVTAARFANNYDQASELAQHKIDELRGEKWSGYTATTFASASSTLQGAEWKLTSDGIVDSGTCANDANHGFTCSFTDIDNIANNGTNVGYFPSGSSGTLEIDPDTTTGALTYIAYNATVTISWSGGGISSGSYTTSTKLVEAVSP